MLQPNVTTFCLLSNQVSDQRSQLSIPKAFALDNRRTAEVHWVVEKVQRWCASVRQKAERQGTEYFQSESICSICIVVNLKEVRILLCLLSGVHFSK